MRKRYRGPGEGGWGGAHYKAQQAIFYKLKFSTTWYRTTVPTRQRGVHRSLKVVQLTVTIEVNQKRETKFNRKFLRKLYFDRNIIILLSIV